MSQEKKTSPIKKPTDRTPHPSPNPPSDPSIEYIKILFKVLNQEKTPNHYLNGSASSMSHEMACLNNGCDIQLYR